MADNVSDLARRLSGDSSKAGQLGTFERWLYPIGGDRGASAAAGADDWRNLQADKIRRLTADEYVRRADPNAPLPPGPTFWEQVFGGLTNRPPAEGYYAPPPYKKGD